MSPRRLPLQRRPLPVRHDRQPGFALIEALVTVVLCAVGLMGLMALQARAIQQSGSAEDTTRAALLANELASQMWTAGTVQLPPAAIDLWRSRVADAQAGGLPGGTGTVTVVDGVARIAIGWSPPHRPAGQVSRYTTDVLVP
jgi:type IV pilus assembly protein PilV